MRASNHSVIDQHDLDRDYSIENIIEFLLRQSLLLKLVKKL